MAKEIMHYVLLDMSHVTDAQVEAVRRAQNLPKAEADAIPAAQIRGRMWIGQADRSMADLAAQGWSVKGIAGTKDGSVLYVLERDGSSLIAPRGIV